MVLIWLHLVLSFRYSELQRMLISHRYGLAPCGIGENTEMIFLNVLNSCSICFHGKEIQSCFMRGTVPAFQLWLGTVHINLLQPPL